VTAHQPPPRLTVRLEAGTETELFAERLRDGRVAIGSRDAGAGSGSTMIVLDSSSMLALSAWLAPLVESAWLDSARARQAESVRNAEDLYGESADAARRLALDVVGEIPPAMLRRAFLLLANSIGPSIRDRLVDRLNRTEDGWEDGMIRREIAEVDESLAYAVAAGALFDAIERGVAGPAADPEGHDPVG
jgi:hypothetical protein